MSFEDRGARLPTTSTTIYTVYPTGGHQGTTTYGFRPDYPQEPPPKYEDVVSGEYLTSNPTSYGHVSNSTNASPSAPPATEPPSRENPKRKSHTGAGAFLFALLLTAIFIWRISIM